MAKRPDTITDMSLLLRAIDAEIALTMAAIDMILAHKGPITPAMRGSLKERREAWVRLVYGQQGKPVDVAGDL